MSNTRKCLTSLLILTLSLSISSVLILGVSAADPPAPTYPPDIPTPSVPQFTLTYADHSFDVPAKTTQSTDPYTGKVTTTTIPGYHVKNFTLDVTIKNQPYPSTINHGNSSTLKYFIQGKGHFESDGYLTSGDGTDGAVVVASNSEYTVVSIPIGISEGSVDYRVKASLGYAYPYYYGLTPFVGWASSDSDWSNAQTITIGTVTSTSTPVIPTVTSIPIPYETMYETTAPTPSGNNLTLPQLDLTVIGFAALGIVVAVLLVFLAMLRKRIRVLELKQNGT
jgi:hypothetical protein